MSVGPSGQVQEPPPLSGVEHLTRAHRLDRFDCGDESLNAWLKRRALANELADHSRTYVIHRDGSVVGYHAIVSGSVQRVSAPRILRRNAPEVIPVLLLARLAVDLEERRRGSRLGDALLKDAVKRCVNGAQISGAKAILVHALNDAARGFYLHYNFTPSPADRLMLFIRIAECRALLGLPPVA